MLARESKKIPATGGSASFEPTPVRFEEWVENVSYSGHVLMTAKFRMLRDAIDYENGQPLRKRDEQLVANPLSDYYHYEIFEIERSDTDSLEAALGFNPRVGWQNLKPGDRVLFDPTSFEYITDDIGREPVPIEIQQVNVNAFAPESRSGKTIPWIYVAFKILADGAYGNSPGDEHEMEGGQRTADAWRFSTLGDSEWRMSNALGFNPSKPYVAGEVAWWYPNKTFASWTSPVHPAYTAIERLPVVVTDAHRYGGRRGRWGRSHYARAPYWIYQLRVLTKDQAPHPSWLGSHILDDGSVMANIEQKHLKRMTPKQKHEWRLGEALGFNPPMWKAGDVVMFRGAHFAAKYPLNDERNWQYEWVPVRLTWAPSPPFTWDDAQEAYIEFIDRIPNGYHARSMKVWTRALRDMTPEERQEWRLGEALGFNPSKKLVPGDYALVKSIEGAAEYPIRVTRTGRLFGDGRYIVAGKLLDGSGHSGWYRRSAVRRMTEKEVRLMRELGEFGESHPATNPRLKYKEGDLVMFTYGATSVQIPLRWYPARITRAASGPGELYSGRQYSYDYAIEFLDEAAGLISTHARERDLRDLSPEEAREWRLSRELGFNPKAFGSKADWKVGDLAVMHYVTRPLNHQRRSAVVKIEETPTAGNRLSYSIKVLDGTSDTYPRVDSKYAVLASDLRPPTEREARPFRLERELGFNPDDGPDWSQCTIGSVWIWHHPHLYGNQYLVRLFSEFGATSTPMGRIPRFVGIVLEVVREEDEHIDSLGKRHKLVGPRPGDKVYVDADDLTAPPDSEFRLSKQLGFNP